ncbi:MAG TPA: presqualene diphosphate synthase HpnD [Gammaproteobacteria bacterium]|nr:presqualene diphosphate synthase HpnD [Gammaproteobacteria bacterium]
MNPDQYCQRRAAASGSSFYYSFLFLPAEQRRAILALYAFCREVDDVVDDCQDPGVARLKLQWWREEIGRAFQGSPQHPVTRALQPQLERYNLPEEYFREIIDGMQMDLDQARYADFSALALYCYRVAGVVGLLAAEIFGYQDRGTLKYATELGTALQLTNILRDVREDARRGRIYLPQDELRRAGVEEEDILRGVSTPPLQSLLAQQAARARDYYQRAEQTLPEVDRPAQRSGLIMSSIYGTLLDEIEADGFRVLERRVALTPLRKLWIAWSTLRREKRRARG